MRITHRSDSVALPKARCRYCGQLIVDVPGVGWLDPDPGDSYDICPAQPYGIHEPGNTDGPA
jgi:hypothetical protein